MGSSTAVCMPIGWRCLVQHAGACDQSRPADGSPSPRSTGTPRAVQVAVFDTISSMKAWDFGSASYSSKVRRPGSRALLSSA